MDVIQTHFSFREYVDISATGQVTEWKSEAWKIISGTMAEQIHPTGKPWSHLLMRWLLQICTLFHITGTMNKGKNKCKVTCEVILLDQNLGQKSGIAFYTHTLSLKWMAINSIYPWFYGEDYHLRNFMGHENGTMSS